MGVSQTLRDDPRERLQIKTCGGDAETLFHTLARHRFDVLVTELAVPFAGPLGALPMLARLREQYSRLRVLVFTTLREACALGAVLATGVAGVVHKQASAEEVRHAVLRVAAGHRYLCATVQQALAKRYVHKSAWGREGSTALTDREAQVMALARHGLPARTIAQRLGRSEKAVIVQRSNAFEKLGLRTDALIYHAPPQALIAG